MSIFNDKALKSVADAVSKVLAQESSHGSEPKSDKEKKLAALAHPKDKITHKDVLVGRGVLKKEELELDEAFPTVADAHKRMNEPKPSGGAGIKQGHRYGGGKQAPDVEDDEDDKKPARGKYGARQNFKRSVKEGFCHLITAYEEGGLKKLHENLYVEEDVWQLDEAQGKITHYLPKKHIEAHKDWVESEGFDTKHRALPKNHPLHKTHVGIVDTPGSDYGYDSEYGTPVEKYKAAMKAKMKKEEVDNETFTKELEDQKASMEGKKKQPSVAAPATQGVKQMPEEVEEENVEQLDELKKSTLSSYVDKADRSVVKLARTSVIGAKPEERQKIYDKTDKKINKRLSGMTNAVKKMSMKEEVELDADEINGVAIETIEERSLTPGEKKEMEKNVKGMKKKLSGFKDRYGDRAKSVIYATATRMAKEKK